MKLKLTKKVVESIEPGAKDQLIWDTEVPGFGLKVTPSGKRTYLLYYRASNGQQRRPKVGDHGVMTVDEARNIAREWLVLAHAGEDVSGNRLKDKSAPTVSQLADRYMRDYAIPNKKPRSVVSDRANLQNHVIPVLGAMKIKDVRRADIERLKLAVRDGKTARILPAKVRGRRIIKGGQGVANRVIALASKMFACAQDWDLIEANPASSIRKFREVRKDRYLSKDEVARLLNALDSVDQQHTVSPAASAAMRVLLFTGMRSGEVLNLRWEEIDLEAACFRIPDTKTGARVIPFGKEVKLQLDRLHTEATKKDYVFSGEGDRPIALRRPWYKVRLLAGIDESATLHTLRHTFASWSVMGGLSLAQVGSLLGHKSPQTTLRYADHALEAVREYAAVTNAVLNSLRTP